MDLKAKNEKLISTLEAHQSSFASIAPSLLPSSNIALLDLSVTNKALQKIDPHDTPMLEKFIWNLMAEKNAHVGVGGYDEDRRWYQKAEQYVGEECRSIHLGVDIWGVIETPVCAPLDGNVHSFNNNAAFGDYGPTIILEHSLDGQTFHTLYGHLTVESLADKMVGQEINNGEQIGAFGSAEVNGDWPPHVHFQIIIDMLGNKGDFPGVALPSKREEFLTNCPDPNLILSLEI